MSEHDTARRWLISILLIGLVGWGLYQAAGVFLYSRDIREAIIVFGCVAAFLLVWIGLLVFVPPRSKPRDEEKPPA